LDRVVDGHFAGGVAQNFFETFVEAEEAGSGDEAGLGGEARVEFVILS